MIIGKDVSSPTEARDFVVDTLRRELIGPSPGFPAVQLNGEEILRPQDPPRYRYSCGVLFPRGVTYSGSIAAHEDAAAIEAAEAVDPAASSPEEGVDDADTSAGVDQSSSDEDDEVDALSNFLPSTMGVSFLCSGGSLALSAEWATYAKSPVPGFPQFGSSGKTPEPWFRSPRHLTIELEDADLVGDNIRRIRRPISGPDAHGQLELDIVSRAWPGGLRLITATLVNASPQNSPINELCFFQCALRVEPRGQTRVLPYPGRPAANMDDEERSLELLYRHRPNYAVGHGCAADWETEGERVVSIRSEALPVFEQAPVVPREGVEGAELSMKKLAAADEMALLKACQALADGYRAWITERAAELEADAQLASELKLTGRRHLDNCRECLRRIEDGISILGTHPIIRAAFQTMNQAMVEQREHYELSSSDSKRRTWTITDAGALPSAQYVEPAYPDSTAWRPFQLAFILMNIRSFLDPSHDERALVDIIWFPTGGGKTEAYLGLAAFSILLRRLMDVDDAGTSVLMRYTLRLLTTQQFQRAASLICALERVRRAAPGTYGQSPISIGLWLGSGVTPNRNEQAVTAYTRLQAGDSENPFVMLRCPWCGVDMGPQDINGTMRVFGYQREKRTGQSDRMKFRCEDPNCDFSNGAGLPLEVVDEGIYESPPTLLIGTVDKFAMMPWEPRARLLFGIDTPAAKSPPDLVIQDELHLIAGPLGSMVGHYETVIDEFCTRIVDGKRVPAKIIASTATIARSAEQALAVYGRPSALFPPQALVAGESFFAQEGAKAGGRTYVGVLATALPSHVTAQVRTLAALLQAPALALGPDAAIDPYWTLVVYFNSLRELGRASTLVQADIREYLNAVWDRIGLREDLVAGGSAMRRFINNFDELTSRLRSTDVPAVLQKLFTALPSQQAVDLCYATSMIQVGLDVPRLSVMSIVGQPKGASEYIQASSRVGRARGKPGLVITNFNPFKPRDRSHFEGFRPFHENAYRHVEATSVTPFSIPVCDRAIHALAVAIARFRVPKLRTSPQAGIDDVTRALISGIILDRINKIDPAESTRAQRALNLFLDDWNRRKPQDYGDLQGSSPDPLIWPAGKPLSPGLTHLQGVVRATASSMRNVDAECEAGPIANYTTGAEA